jgi:hypothetical protein
MLYVVVPILGSLLVIFMITYSVFLIINTKTDFAPVINVLLSLCLGVAGGVLIGYFISPDASFINYIYFTLPIFGFFLTLFLFYIKNYDPLHENVNSYKYSLAQALLICVFASLGLVVGLLIYGSRTGQIR